MVSSTRFTERLRLESVGLHLFDDLFAIHQDEGIARWYGGKWTAEFVRNQAETFAKGWETHGVSKWIAYDKVSGELIGRGGPSRVFVDGAERYELGWGLLERFWGRGYATEIGRAGLEFVFETFDTDEVVAFTEPHNIRSRAVMERLRMRYDRDIVQGDEEFVLYVMRREDFVR